MADRYQDSTASARWRGLARVTPATVGVAVLGGVATVTVAVGLAVSRSADATPTSPSTGPADVPATAGTSTAALHPVAPRNPGKASRARHMRRRPPIHQQPQQVAPATQAPATAQSSGS